MKTIKEYGIAICLIAAVLLLLLSFASYIFSTQDMRLMLAQAACIIAVLGIIVGFLSFDDKSK